MWGVPCYTLLIVLWGEVLVSSWNRQCATLTYAWEVMDSDEGEIREQLSKEVRCLIISFETACFQSCIFLGCHDFEQDGQVCNNCTNHGYVCPWTNNAYGLLYVSYG